MLWHPRDFVGVLLCARKRKMILTPISRRTRDCTAVRSCSSEETRDKKRLTTFLSTKIAPACIFYFTFTLTVDWSCKDFSSLFVFNNTALELETRIHTSEGWPAWSGNFLQPHHFWHLLGLMLLGYLRLDSKSDPSWKIRDSKEEDLWHCHSQLLISCVFLFEENAFAKQKEKPFGLFCAPGCVQPRLDLYTSRGDKEAAKWYIKTLYIHLYPWISSRNKHSNTKHANIYCSLKSRFIFSARKDIFSSSKWKASQS